MTAVAHEVDEDLDSERPAQEYGDIVPTPTLLDKGTPDPTICKTVHRMWTDQKEKHARYVVECEVNERRRGGECNIWVKKVQDQASFIVYKPAGSVGLMDTFGQLADQTCQEFVAQLNQDPALPNAIPSTGEDDDRDSAEFSSKILKIECSESGLDANEAVKLAQDYACSHGSGWIWVRTDPMGGGRVPVELDARTVPVPHPDQISPPFPPAQHADEAMVDPVTGGKWEGPTEPRFVGPDGKLGTEKQGAALRWMPRVSRQVIPGTHVRLWPSTAQDVWDAHALLYFDYQPRSVVVEWFPDMKELTDEEWEKATSFRLSGAEFLLPKKNDKPHDPKPEGRPEDWLVLVSCLWAPEGSTFPDGAYLACIGEEKVAQRGTWILETEQGREKRDIPWVQVRQFRGSRGHPQGKPLMNFIGAACEYLAQLYGRFEELTDMAVNRKRLLPFSSTIRPEDLDDPSNNTLYFQPGHKPEYEQVPEPPRALEKLLEMTREAVKAASFLETSRGIEAPEANSGRQALAMVAQAHAGLADVHQNQSRAWIRFWRLMGQCIRADYTIPQLTRVTGPDGSYKMERWTRSDLGSTQDVEIQKGTGTMLNGVQKVQMYAEARQLTGMDPDDVLEQMTAGLSPYVAFQDNPFLQRIRRQISAWEKGPPEGWQPPQAPVDEMGAPMMQPPPMDPMTQMPAMGPDGMPLQGQPVPPPPDPVLAEMWAPVDSDMSPVAAKWRIRELARAQQSARYFTFPPEWRVALDMEYSRAMQALTPPPAPVPGGDPGKPPKDPTKPELSENEQAQMGAAA